MLQASQHFLYAVEIPTESQAVWKKIKSVKRYCFLTCNCHAVSISTLFCTLLKFLRNGIC